MGSVKTQPRVGFVIRCKSVFVRMYSSFRRPVAARRTVNLVKSDSIMSRSSVRYDEIVMNYFETNL